MEAGADKEADDQPNRQSNEVGDGKQVAPVDHWQRHSFAWYLVALLLAAGLPCLCVILGWSSIGAGETFYDLLDSGYLLKWVFFGISAVLFLGLYLADFFWPPHIPHRFCVLAENDRYLGRGLIAVAIVSAVIGGFFLANAYSSVPLIILVLFGPVSVMGVRGTTHPKEVQALRGPSSSRDLKLEDRVGIVRAVLYRERDTKLFYSAAGTAHAVCGCVCIVVWIIFAVGYSSELDITSEEKELMFFAAPLIAGVSNLFFALFVLIRLKMARIADDYDTELVEIVQQGGGDLHRELGSEMSSAAAILGQHLKEENMLDDFNNLSEEKQEEVAKQHAKHLAILSALMKSVGCCLLLLIGAAYIAAQLVATSTKIAQLTLSFLAIFASTFVALNILWFRRMIGRMKQWLVHLPLWRMTAGLASNQWVQAGALTAVLPYSPLFLLLAAINQFVRKRRGLYKMIPQDEGEGPETADMREKTILTARVEATMEHLKSLDWLEMTTKIYVWGVLLVVYVLFPKLLNVFLAWLSNLIGSLPFAVIIICTLVAGMCCFLLPPVPGVPVYLFGGFVISAACHKTDSRELAPGAPDGFWIGAIIAMAVGFVLKLMACAMQQKLIGGFLGFSLMVRQQVGVHKPFFRAVDAVLREKGMTIGKVSVLCGGPDWPTSVLAGLLDLPLLDMELGTTPIILYIAPCVLSGAFYVRRSEGGVWESAADLMVASTLFVTLALWVGAAWAIQSQLEEKHWELSKPLEKNVELDWLDYRSEKLNQASTITLQEVPPVILALFVAGAVVLLYVGHMFYWSAASFFNEFEVNDDVSTFEWYGDTGLIMSTGLAGIIVVLVGCLGWVTLAIWLHVKQRGPRAAEAANLVIEEPDWKANRRLEAQKASPMRRPTLAILGSADQSKTIGRHTYSLDSLRERPSDTSRERI